MPANNFLLNTAYPIDKIVYMAEGSWTPTGFDSETGLAHKTDGYQTGIDAPHLVMGEWSDDNWNTSYPLGAGRYYGEWYRRDSQSPLYEKYTSVNALGYAGEAFSGVFGDNGFMIGIVSAYSAEIKYRAYLVIPESSTNADTPKTASLSNPFNLDTRANYPKLVEDRLVFLQPNTPLTIYHGLGFTPFVRVWDSLIAETYEDCVFSDSSNSIKVLDGEKMVLQSEYKRFVYYRIYADEI